MERRLEYRGRGGNMKVVFGVSFHSFDFSACDHRVLRGGGGGGVIGCVGVVCYDGVDSGVGGVVRRRSAMWEVSRLSSRNCVQVKASISAMIVRVPEKDRWCGTAQVLSVLFIIRHKATLRQCLNHSVTRVTKMLMPKGMVIVSMAKAEAATCEGCDKNISKAEGTIWIRDLYMTRVGDSNVDEQYPVNSNADEQYSMNNSKHFQLFDHIQLIITLTSPTTMDPDDGATVGNTKNHHQQPLLNLSKLQTRMNHVQQFLTQSLNNNTLINDHQMNLVSQEITAAINQVIINGAALVSLSNDPQKSTQETPSLTFDVNKSTPSLTDFKDVLDKGYPKTEVLDNVGVGDWDIVELDAVELLAEHLHFCDFCGKGFKRDANLRMHMRAHGNKFKTLEALAKPDKLVTGNGGGRTRFSCPFSGCSRNKLHNKFRPLKSVICVKNHFKRSHCPKMYSCNRCHKKNFSVLADLKSHLKHCGETKWKCSCGTSFTRKDKLFGHIALFEGHMPAMPTDFVTVVEDDDKKAKGVVVEQDMLAVGTSDDVDWNL
nr:protein sensitive to proton rhizotoxicity 1-like [Tanacetum cinerariifolium]